MKQLTKINAILLVISFFSIAGFSQVGDPTPIKLDGRVIASVESLITGSGVGPHFYSFIFAATHVGEQKSNDPTFVRILYERYSDYEFLEDSFFDFKQQYRLTTIRDSKCDASPREFAYENFNAERRSVMRFLEGAEKIQVDDEAVLNCYRLTFKGIKKLR